MHVDAILWFLILTRKYSQPFDTTAFHMHSTEYRHIRTLLAALATETAEQCLACLPPVGLAVMVGANTAELPEETTQWLEDQCG
jgi:hypothetical protein